MDTSRLVRVDEATWRLEPEGAMRVPAIIYGTEDLVRAMDDKVLEQIRNVACLPGIVKAAYALPDAHWGYGFPIGGVAAFDAEAGGVVSAGGVGFDISCGVRTITTGLERAEVEPVVEKLADALYAAVPVGLGRTGQIRLSDAELDAMLEGGARWAVAMGWGDPADLERIEEKGRMAGADPGAVSKKAKERQRAEMGTLGSGNHYLEIQVVDRILDPKAAAVYGLVKDQVVITIHCGSRGLGHQIGTEFLREMALAAPRFGIVLPDRELACAPLRSELGQRYLGAMRAAINCALANREIIDHLARGVLRRLFPRAKMALLFDVSHNTCKLERHRIDGEEKELFVHRKGATRAFDPVTRTFPNPCAAWASRC